MFLLSFGCLCFVSLLRDALDWSLYVIVAFIGHTRLFFFCSNVYYMVWPYYTDRSKAVLLLWIIFVIFVMCLSCFLVCYCSFGITCWERAGHLAILCVKSYCVLVTFPCGVLLDCIDS